MSGIGVPFGAAVAMVVAVVLRPRLWWTALRQLARVTPRGWWRRPPYLPVPDPAYLRFRLETQYGSAAGRAAITHDGAQDLVTYLEWCRESDR